MADIVTIGGLALDIEKVVAYGLQQTTNNSNLIDSGIMVRDAVFDGLANSTGTTAKMPYWNDLSGASEVLPTDGTTELTTDDISSGLDIAVINHKGKAFAVQDLVKELAKVQANDPNADPMGIIASRLGIYWANEYQTTLLSILKGAFADSSMSGLVLDISGESTAATRTANADTLIDAEGKLGDKGGILTAIMMHSATERKLRKDDLIDYVVPSQGGGQIAMYAGKRVIVNDSLPVATGNVYTSYLFGAGAIAYGEATPDYPALESQRKALAGVDQLISRRKFLLHPRGVAFDGNPTGVSPTNAEFETSSNWTRKYENKNIKIVQFKHLLA
jgi:hypothetical protein